ncbi:IS21 family transposase [Caloranaerobacter azorensis]
MYTTIKTLFDKGYNKTQIANMLGIDRGTVRNVLKGIENGEEIKRKPVPSILDPYKEIINTKINQELSAKRIFQDIASEYGYTGSYDTVKKYVRVYKQSHTKVYMVNNTLPGEEAQVDFGYIGKIPAPTGNLKKAWVFCMVLSYSRLMYCEIVFNQEVKTFIKCHENAFRYFGGIPKIVKIDNLKAAILEANFYESVYQREYQEFSKHYGFSSIPCRVKTPTDKAKIESGVKYVKNNFFKGRSLKTYEEYKDGLKSWLDEICNIRVHGTTKKIPKEVLETEEIVTLLPLPIEKYEFSVWTTRKVNTNCHICYDSNFYSVPYKFVNKEVTLRISDKIIKIYCNYELIATHLKLEGKGQFSTNTVHYPEYKVKTKTQLQLEYRQKMEKIGQNAVKFFDNILEKQKNNWGKPIYGILKLADKYGYEVIEKACIRALMFNSLKYQTIKNICEKGLYNLPLDNSISLVTKDDLDDLSRPLSEYEKLLYLKEVR